MSPFPQSGFALISVVVVLLVLAAVGALISLESPLETELVASDAEHAQALYIAEAGLNHAVWQANQASCTNYQNVPATAFGQDTYAATVTPTSGSPITIAATGTSAGGTTRSLTRTPVPIYDPNTGLLSLKPDATDGKDTLLKQASSGKNYGVFQTLAAHLGDSHSLLEFPVASIPDTALIREARLRLWVTSVNIAGEIGAYGVNTAWNEGTGAGEPCDDGATWWYTDCWADWPTYGGHADADPSAKQSVTSTGAWVEFDLTDLTQAWVSGQRPNYGVLLKPTGSADVSFRSSDAIALDEYPEFIVTYVCECGVGPTTTATLQPGASDGKDSWVTGGKPNWNYARSTDIQINESGGPQRAVVEFDLSGLPSDAIVQSAELELYVVDIYQTNVGDVYAHAISDSWVEGTCNGSGCTADGITWDWRDGTVPWTNPGVDFDATPAAITFVDTNNAWFSWDVTDAVSQWMSTGDNNGLLLKGLAGEANIDFASSDAPDATQRPKLTIEYTCPCGVCASGPPPACNADYVPTAEIASWGYGAGNSYADMHGITYVPEGFVLDGATAPAGGAYVAVDWNEDFFTMYDSAGTVLSQTLGTPAGSMDGVALVEGGTHAGKLAVVQDMASDNFLHFVDPTGVAGTVSIDIGGISPDPSGITYIDQSDTGTYDEHLAIVDGNNGSIFILDQAGSLVFTIDVSATVGDLEGIVHLKGTDKFLTVDQADDLARIVDTAATVTDSYDLAPYTLLRPRAATVNLESCDHIVANNRGATGSDADEVVFLNAGGGAGPISVLLVVGNDAPLGSKDDGRKMLMENSWGFTVTVIDDGDTQDNFNTQMAAADVVYVSGTVGGGTLANKVTGTTKGVVNEFNGKLDNFGFSSATGATVNDSTYSKTDDAHYITSPFGGAAVTVFTTSLSMPVPSGTLAPDLQNVGEVSGTLALVTLDAGAQRWDATPAPARRAHLPFGSAETSQLTADGETIMQRAIRWAAGEGGGGGGAGGPSGIVFQEFTERKYSSTAFVDSNTPPGTTEGDLLIATVVTDGSTASSMSPPAGWTVVDLADQSGAVTYGVWWKLAGASEPASYTFSWSGSESAYSTVMRFTGHDPVSPIDVTAAAGGSSTAPSSPAVTTTVSDTMILRLGGFDDDDITTDAPGLTGHTAITMDDTGNGPATSSSGAGYVMQAAAGDSGTSTFALTGSEEYRTVTIAIAPAP